MNSNSALAAKSEIAVLPQMRKLFDEQVHGVPAETRPTEAEAQEAVRTLLRFVCEDAGREGLVETPKRVIKAYREFFSGYAMDPAEILDKTFKEVGGYDDMVMVGKIPFYSHCEHHMVKFEGNAWIAYFPDDGVVGLSKFARLVQCYGRRLQTQETMTSEIGKAIDEFVTKNGCAVMIEAGHDCMSMRGVAVQGSTTTTRYYSGRYKDEREEREAFMRMVAGKAA